MKGKILMQLSLKLLLTCSLVTSFMFADTKTPTPKETMSTHKSQFAYVNTHEIITLDPNLLSSASDEWRDNYNNLKKMLEPVEKEIQELASNLEKGKTEFETLQQSGIASQDTLTEKYKEMYQLNTDLQKRSQELNQFAQERLAAAQTQLQPKILKAIQEVAKEDSYQIVFDGMTILAAPGADNATSKVLTKINRDYAIEKAKKLSTEKTLEPAKPMA